MFGRNYNRRNRIGRCKKMSNKKENKLEPGVIALIVCGLIAVALIVACVFFRDQFFGLFM